MTPRDAGRLRALALAGIAAFLVLLLRLVQIQVIDHPRLTREATARASVQVTSEMLRVLRGEKPHVLVNPEVGPRLGLR